MTEGVRSDFPDWQDYDGDIPEATGFMEATVVAFNAPIDPGSDVVDLSVL